MIVDSGQHRPGEEPAAPGEQRQRQRDQRAEDDGADGQPDVLAQVAAEWCPSCRPRRKGRTRGSAPRPTASTAPPIATRPRAQHRALPRRATPWTLLRTPPRPASAAGTGGAAAEIRLEGVSKVYADGTVGVAELDLTFAAGELTVLVGPSGLRQDDDDEDDQPADRADDRPDPARRRGRHPRRPRPAAPPDRLRHPEHRAVPAPDRAHQRRHRAAAARLGQAADPDPGRRAAGDRRPRPGRPRRPLPRASSPAVSGSGPAWPGRWPPTPPCCSWTSRSPPSTRSSGSGCSRSSCGCRRPCARRSSSSPTTSRRPCGSATGSR